MSEIKQKLLVLDGSNLLFQMFYGMPSRILGKTGKPVHGTLGFVGALLKMLRLMRPTHAVVLFDGECHNERKDVDENYKANRPDYSQMPEEETPFSQLPDIWAALDYLKICHAETTVCETDDVVAGYALTYGKEIEIVISSFDSDFFQLITKNVSVFRYRGDKSILCDEDYVREKFGVEPCQYADYKSLVGDNADNVKGVRGVGPKTAAALIRQFGDIQTLLENVDRIEKPSIRKAIKEERERILVNQRLIKLCGCAELPFDLKELAYRYAGEKTGEVLSALGIL